MKNEVCLRFRNLFVSHLICFLEYLFVLCFIVSIPDNTTARHTHTDVDTATNVIRTGEAVVICIFCTCLFQFLTTRNSRIHTCVWTNN